MSWTVFSLLKLCPLEFILDSITFGMCFCIGVVEGPDILFHSFNVKFLSVLNTQSVVLLLLYTV